MLLFIAPFTARFDWGGCKEGKRDADAYPTIIQFPASPTTSPFSSFVKPQDLAMCRIPAGDGFGGRKSRVITIKFEVKLEEALVGMVSTYLEKIRRMART